MSIYNQNMFVINTNTIKGYNLNSPLNDWFIIVNGQKCKCLKSVCEQMSPIINSFYQENENENITFVTQMPNGQAFFDSSSVDSNETNDSANSINTIESIVSMISKIFCGEEITIQKNNIELLFLIGKHFEIKEIIDKIEEYQKYSIMIQTHLDNDLIYQDMIKLEKILLFEINETNFEIKVKEYESLIKKIPIICFVHFVINICTKNYQNKKINPYEFMIEIIKNVDKIVPNTLSLFISTLFHKLALINSKFVFGKDKYGELVIDSLIQQLLIEGLMKNFKENIKINHYEIIVSTCFLKYFVKKGEFFMISKHNITRNNEREIKDEFDFFLESLKNDDVESFQNYIAHLKIDINGNVQKGFTNRIPFLIENGNYSLIELAAFLGSINCFTFLNNNRGIINKSILSNFAVAGGNPEIIHFCERDECVFNERTLDISIEYHRHEITKWLVETKHISIKERNLRTCIVNFNFETMKYLIMKGINIRKMIIYICESNNTILFEWLNDILKSYSMEMIYQENKKSVLHFACEQNNPDIVKLLMTNNEIDINSNFEVITYGRKKK